MSDKRKCYNCEYFHIRQEPIPHHMDAGLAECKKHNMVVDFYNHGKLKRLECVEGQEILDMSDCKIISDDDAVF